MTYTKSHCSQPRRFISAREMGKKSRSIGIPLCVDRPSIADRAKNVDRPGDGGMWEKCMICGGGIRPLPDRVGAEPHGAPYSGKDGAVRRLLDGEAEKAKQQLYCKPCMDQRNCPGQWPGQLYERVKVRRKKKRGDEFERTGAARWLLLFTPGVRLD